MSTDTREERLQRHIQELYASDAQFANARPDESISAAMRRKDRCGVEHVGGATNGRHSPSARW